MKYRLSGMCYALIYAQFIRASLHPCKFGDETIIESISHVHATSTLYSLTILCIPHQEFMIDVHLFVLASVDVNQ